jgi:hypothetical protein
MRIAGTPETVSEQQARRTIPVALPAPAGLARFVARLSGDRIYRRCLLGAYALALLAGSAGGLMALQFPGFIVALWAVVATSVVAASIEPQLPGEFSAAQQRARDRYERVFALMLVPTTLLMVFRSGMEAWLPLCISLAIALATRLLSGNPQGHAFLNGLLCLGVIPATTLWNPVPQQIARMACFFLALGAAVLLVVLASKRGAGLASSAFLARVALLAWLLATLGMIHTNASPSNLPLLLAAALLVVDLLRLRDPRFVFVLAGVLILQLGSLAWTGLDEPVLNEIGKSGLNSHLLILLLQPIATLAGATLLAWAGFRSYEASLLQLPRSTYRIAPLCVVPRLDRAQDHPVKIDVL